MGMLPWRGRGLLAGWRGTVMVLFLAHSLARAEKTAYVSRQTGACPPGSPQPVASAQCVSWRSALQDQAVTRIVLVEDVELDAKDYVLNSLNKMYDIYVQRDLEVTGLRKEVMLNFNFLSDAAVINASMRVYMHDVTIANGRRSAGLGIDFFVGAEDSVLELSSVVRWRYVCTSPQDAVKVHTSYPRAPGVAGTQTVTIIPSLVWRGERFDAGSVYYVDFAMVVAPVMSESAAYLPGYVLILRNVTRVCTTLVPDSCFQTESRDQCLLDYTDRYIDSLAGGGQSSAGTIAGAVVGSVGGLAIIGGILALLLARRRRRRREEEAATKPMMRIGPLEDLVLSNKQHGWRVTHRANPAHGSSNTGTGGAGGGSSLGDRLELGVLLGAGSFGRVYKGRWHGKDVAVKVMQHDARTASRIANEVELMMMMEHVNILKAHDVITWTHSSGSNAVKQSASGGRPSAKSDDPASKPSAADLLRARASHGAGAAALASAANGAHRSPRVAGAGAGAASTASLQLTGTQGSSTLLQAAHLLLGPASGGGGAGSSGASGAAGTPPTNGGGGGGAGRAGGGLHVVPLPAPSQLPPAQGDAGAAGGAPPPPPPPQQQQQQLVFVPMRTLAGGVVSPLIPEGEGLAQGSLASGAQLAPREGDDVESQLAPLGAAGSSSVAAAADAAARLQLPPQPTTSGAAAAAPAVGARAGGGSGSSDGSKMDAEAQTWLIVEYCDAGTLADAVRSGRLGARGAPDMAKVLVRLRDVAAGLAYLHSRNVLHGDLKAANVMLTSSVAAPFGLVAKVADFGLSRMLRVGQTHRSTRTVGTVTHMPPELLRLGKLSPAGDVYAFGIIMWEVYTGAVAFDKQHYGEVFERVVLRDERPPVPPDMPEAYALLMSRCWAADPMQRPGFDTVLRLINLMIENMLAAEDHCSAALAGAAPDEDVAPADGAAPVSSGRGAAGSSGAGRLRGAGRDGSHFIQDL